jgi:thiamine biosynthesis lipoprotein
MKYKRTLVFIAVAAMLASLPGCAADRSVTDTGYYFDTVVTITLYGTNKTALLDGCFDLSDKYDTIFSRTYTTGELYQLNAAAAESDATVTVSPELAEIISDSLYYSRLSDGTFDITIGAVTRLWDFKSENAVPPDAADIAAALEYVGYARISVDLEASTVSMLQGTYLDLGGIAKGFIADKIRDYLLSEGIENAVINLGGNVLCMGGKMDGSDFNIGIQKPFSESDLFAVVKTKDMSVVTSGDYERYFIYDGILYHHILDPATGYSVNNGLNAVTMLANDCLTAEILSTTCFVLGADKARALIDGIDGVYALFIFSDGTYETSSGFAENVDITYQ